jgi:hypothetical protein
MSHRLLSMIVIALTLVLASGVGMSQYMGPNRDWSPDWWKAFDNGKLCDACLQPLGGEPLWHRGIKGCAFAIYNGLAKGNADPPAGGQVPAACQGCLLMPEGEDPD